MEEGGPAALPHADPRPPYDAPAAPAPAPAPLEGGVRIRGPALVLELALAAELVDESIQKMGGDSVRLPSQSYLNKARTHGPLGGTPPPPPPSPLSLAPPSPLPHLSRPPRFPAPSHEPWLLPVFGSIAR